jgi:hypothetical protein
MLIELFQTFSESLPRKHGDKTFHLLPDSLETIPASVAVADIIIELRHRYSTNGLIDNVVIKTNRMVAKVIGLWSILTALQNCHHVYELVLLDETSHIKRLRNNLQPEHKQSGLLIMPHSFAWKPMNMGLVTAKWKNGYLGERCHIAITNDSGIWFSDDEFRKRDILEGFGGIGGSCVFGEFLLNFALDSCNLNYENLKYRWEESILDESSCEVRIELVAR